jgi:hypothetical protein
VFAALLWRVHLVFWPFYAIFAAYVVVRILRSETSVTWTQAAAVFGLLGLTLIPVAKDAIKLVHEARTHVVAALPAVRDLRRTLKFLLIAQCGGGAILAALLLHRHRDNRLPPLSSWVLILGWWLWHPLALFAFSHITGDSVYVDRYLSLALPGAALAATLAAACALQERDWRLCSAVLGLCVLIALGQWLDLFKGELWPVHHNSDWRAAARTVNAWTVDADTPVLLPSPFIEAKPPAWRPDYPLPGFLYCYLPVYKISGKPYLLPFERSPQSERYASELLPTLSASPRFLIYGGDKNVFVWRSFFASKPELREWGNRQLHSFGDVDVAIFENPSSSRALASVVGRVP